MAGAITFWILAAVYGFATWNAHRTGKMFLTRGRFVVPQPPEEVEWSGYDAKPPLRLSRENNPKGFHDAMVIRWWVVGGCLAAGAAFALVQWLGISK